MSALAKKLPKPESIETRIRRGPTGACDIYGDGDLEDWRAVDNLRRKKSWAVAHETVDETLGITAGIDQDKFRYHFKGGCWHWTPAQKRTIRAETAVHKAKSA